MKGIRSTAAEGEDWMWERCAFVTRVTGLKSDWASLDGWKLPKWREIGPRGANTSNPRLRNFHWRENLRAVSQWRRQVLTQVKTSADVFTHVKTWCEYLQRFHSKVEVLTRMRTWLWYTYAGACKEQESKKQEWTAHTCVLVVQELPPTDEWSVGKSIKLRR